MMWPSAGDLARVVAAWLALAGTGCTPGPELIVAGESPHALIIHDGDLLWIEQRQSGARVLMRANSDGTAVEELDWQHAPYRSCTSACRVAVASDAIYWHADRLHRIDLATGHVTTAAASDDVVSVTVDDTAVYWATITNDGGAVYSMPLAGGPVATLWSGRPVGELRVVGDQLFFLGGGLNRMPKTGGSHTRLSDRVAWFLPRYIVDGDRVYWTGGDIYEPSEIWTTNTDTGAPEELLGRGNAFHAYDLDVDDEFVYWMDYVDLGVIPKAGGAPIMLLRDAGGLGSIAVDDYAIYWTHHDGIRRWPKP